MANQVLFATGGECLPLRVAQARGYPLSTFLFTNYGLDQAGWEALKKRYAPEFAEPGDDFSAWFSRVLGSRVSIEQALKVAAARAAAQVALQALHRHGLLSDAAAAEYGAFAVDDF